MGIINESIEACSEPFHRLMLNQFPFFDGNKVTFYKTATEDQSKSNFYRFLNLIFTYSGTLSLDYELKSIKAKDLKIGDMLIKGGSPGHIVMLCDEVVNDQGDKLFLIFQGNTPAQSVHLVKNLTDNSISPWYTLEDDAEISANQEYLVGAGAIPITNATNAANITGIKIIQPDVSDNTDFAFHNISIDVLDTLSDDSFVLLGNEISIFPNPSNGNITIKNSGVVINTASMIDVNGREIVSYDLKGITTNHNLDLSSILVSGMYFVTISSEKGEITKRIIIN